MNAFQALSLLPVTWLSFCLYTLLRNYRQASKLGVPLVVTLISPDNPLWIALQSSLPTLFRKVNFASIDHLRYCRLGWEFKDRYVTHERLGDAFMVVTPAKNWLLVGNASAAYEIFSRSRDFGRPVWMLGECVERERKSIDAVQPCWTFSVPISQR